MINVQSYEQCSVILAMFNRIKNVQSYELCSVILTMFSHINSVQSCINEMKFLPWPFLGVH